MLEIKNNTSYNIKLQLIFETKPITLNNIQHIKINLTLLKKKKHTTTTLMVKSL